MRRYVPELICSLGVAILVGGVFAFIYGVTRESAWAFVGGSKVWAVDVCIGGTIAGVVGSAFAAFGTLMMRSRSRGASV